MMVVLNSADQHGNRELPAPVVARVLLVGDPSGHRSKIVVHRGFDLEQNATRTTPYAKYVPRRRS